LYRYEKNHQTLLNFAILAGNGKKRTFSYKVACKKISWSGQRGGIALCLSPLKYATVRLLEFFLKAILKTILADKVILSQPFLCVV